MHRYRLPTTQHWVRLSKEWDKSTGQVFDEYTLSRHHLNHGDSNSRWHMTRDSAPQAPKSPSLFNMALKVVLLHTTFMTKEHLQVLPSGVLARIWHCLETKPVCLQDWKLFSSLLLSDEHHAAMGLYNFHKSIPRPAADFKYYVAPMTCLTTDFITHLVIGKDLACVMSELLCLADMKNLGILEMREPAYDQGGGRYPFVTDRLIQSWAEKNNPFPLLRVLKMHGYLSMTVKSLTWVTGFPSLAVYDVLAPGLTWGGWVKEMGWEVYNDPVLYNPLAREMVAMAHGGSSSDETRARHAQIATGNVDPQLLSVYTDRHCHVQFVAHGQAPRLTDQLVPSPAEPDATISQSTSEKSKSQTEDNSSADFWRYALVGQLTNDKDLKREGVEVTRQAMAGSWLLPSRPIARLDLGVQNNGDFPSDRRHSILIRLGGDAKIHVQTRQQAIVPQAEAKTKRKSNSEDSGAPGPPLRQKKRTNMQDMLQSFSG